MWVCHCLEAFVSELKNDFLFFCYWSLNVLPQVNSQQLSYRDTNQYFFENDTFKYCYFCIHSSILPIHPTSSAEVLFPRNLSDKTLMTEIYIYGRHVWSTTELKEKQPRTLLWTHFVYIVWRHNKETGVTQDVTLLQLGARTHTAVQGTARDTQVGSYGSLKAKVNSKTIPYISFPQQKKTVAFCVMCKLLYTVTTVLLVLTNVTVNCFLILFCLQNDNKLISFPHSYIIINKLCSHWQCLMSLTP